MTPGATNMAPMSGCRAGVVESSTAVIGSAFRPDWFYASLPSVGSPVLHLGSFSCPKLIRSRTWFGRCFRFGLGSLGFRLIVRRLLLQFLEPGLNLHANASSC